MPQPALLSAAAGLADYKTSYTDATGETSDDHASDSTHDHADQAHGIDDLRPFFLNQRERIPTYMDQATWDGLLNRFSYVFETRGGYPAILDPRLIPPLGVDFAIEGPSGAIPVHTFDVDHGGVRAVGYRFGESRWES